MTVSCLGFGLAGLYFGYFHSSTVCDSSQPSCHFHAAGTIEPLSTFVGALFFLIGVYLLIRALRRPRVSGSASMETRLEISAAEQARVAREARASYLTMSTKRHKSDLPSEFDRQMLSLFDSIEAGAVDIDAKIEALRSYVRHEGVFQGWRDQFTARLVWQRGAASLQWVPATPETWQLRCNWNRLLRIVGSTWGSQYTIAPRWIVPDLVPPSAGTF